MTAAKARILVVDDNSDTAESLSLFLQMHGHEVRVAHDGEKAVAEASSWHPQVALLDIQLLGGMDGYEVARQLRATCPAPLRLVALTGCAEEEDRRRAEEAGFDRFLVKPVGPEELEATLCEE